MKDEFNPKNIYESANAFESEARVVLFFLLLKEKEGTNHFEKIILQVRFMFSLL